MLSLKRLKDLQFVQLPLILQSRHLKMPPVKSRACNFIPKFCTLNTARQFLKNWLINIAGCQPDWTTGNIAENEIAKAKRVNWQQASYLWPYLAEWIPPLLRQLFNAQ
jgi:hypothetical protein